MCDMSNYTIRYELEDTLTRRVYLAVRLVTRGGVTLVGGWLTGEGLISSAASWAWPSISPLLIDGWATLALALDFHHVLVLCVVEPLPTVTVAVYLLGGMFFGHAHPFLTLFNIHSRARTCGEGEKISYDCSSPGSVQSQQPPCKAEQ